MDSEQRARELLREVCAQLHGVGCGPCIGSDAPMEDLHGRIAKFLNRRPDKHCRHCDGSGSADAGGECPCVVYRALEQREAVLSDAKAECDTCGGMVACPRCDATPPRDVPDGWVLVPREPTEAMRKAHSMYGDTSDWWNAVIAAAQSGEGG